MSTSPAQNRTLKHRIGMVHHRRLLLTAGEAIDQNRARQKWGGAGWGPWDGTGKPRIGRNTIRIRRMRAKVGEAGAAGYGDIKVSDPSI